MGGVSSIAIKRGRGFETGSGKPHLCNILSDNNTYGAAAGDLVERPLARPGDLVVVDWRLTIATAYGPGNDDHAFMTCVKPNADELPLGWFGVVEQDRRLRPHAVLYVGDGGNPHQPDPDEKGALAAVKFEGTTNAFVARPADANLTSGELLFAAAGSNILSTTPTAGGRVIGRSANPNTIFYGAGINELYVPVLLSGMESFGNLP
ncbi:MAG: hypothetical protein B7733_06375 [Myxococcales bacterium FL481]|nr:MAG: hypothetical protein B7733_06375 [Myxococcales bacterium FL481]